MKAVKKVLLIAAVLAGNICADAQVVTLEEFPVKEPPAGVEVLVPYRKGNKWGYSNLEKKLVIPPSFDTAIAFGIQQENLGVQPCYAYAWVKKGGKGQWVSRSGKLFAEGINVEEPPIVSQAGSGKRTEYAAPVRESRRVGIVEAPPAPESEPHIFRSAKNGTYGLTKGRDTLLQAEYDSLRFVSWKRDFVAAKTSRGWGMVKIGEKAEWLVPAEFQEVKHFDPYGDKSLYVVQTSEGKGLYSNGIMVLKPEYTDIYKKEKLSTGRKIGAVGKQGVMLFDMDGTKVAGPFDEMGGFAFRTEITWVKKGGKIGFIDRHGKLFIPYKYDDTRIVDRPYIFIVLNGRGGYIGMDGKEYFEN